MCPVTDLIDTVRNVGREKKKKKAHTWNGKMGKVHGTRPCALWKGRTTAGSTGIQGTRPEAGGCGTEPWCCCRSYAPRFTLPVATFNKVTNGSPALCAIRYCPLSNLENQIRRGCVKVRTHILKHVMALAGISRFLPHDWNEVSGALRKQKVTHLLRVVE